MKGRFYMKDFVKEWGKIVGSNLRQLRMESGETQAQLGEIIGYGATTVANYESGERLPDLVTAYIIAKHYRVPMEVLMEKEA